jgi:hypothetical protein
MQHTSVTSRILIVQARLAQKLDHESSQPPIQPACLSLGYFGDTLEPIENLAPSRKNTTKAWEIWKMPPKGDMQFWRSTDVGSVITFEIELTVGKM